MADRRDHHGRVAVRRSANQVHRGELGGCVSVVRWVVQALTALLLAALVLSVPKGPLLQSLESGADRSCGWGGAG